MRRPLACCFALALAAAVAGCRHSCDRVEEELRAREIDVRELREELDRCSIYNQSLQHELRALRGDVGPGGEPANPVRSLSLGRSTGARNDSDCPADDCLQVVLEPKDCDNQSVKVPGAALIQVQEITKEGTKRPLSTWEVPPEQLRKSWRNGLMTTGYVLVFPWKVYPSTEKLRVTAQFQVPDGRVFEADKDITIRLVPANRRPAPADKPATPAAPDGPPLPSPRPLDPDKIGQQSAPEVPGVLASPRQQADLSASSPAAEMLKPVPLSDN
jgi:hypothetical protein